MKLFRKFALLAVVSSVLGSALVLGCGGGAAEEDAAAGGAAGNTPAAGNAPAAGAAAEAD